MTRSATAELEAKPASAEPASRLGRIAYLCSQYPAVSHTFVLREVRALRELGAEISTFSVRRAGSDHVLSWADHRAFASTYAILPPSWRALFTAHLQLGATAPFAYLSTLLRALRLAPPGVRGRLWQCFYFAESVLLWRECRRLGIRHIHVHLANTAADVALLASSLGSAVEPERPWSWSFTMHGPTEFADVSHYRLAAKAQDARFVVCISDYARSQMMALTPPETWHGLHVIHVGLPLEQFPPSRSERTRQRTPTILCLGRLVPEKGQAILLEAAALLYRRGNDLSVTLAGDGPSRGALEGLAEKLGIASRVTFAGAVGQDEIHALYADASIFCLPSFAEGIPVALMEAMAMELPVVSTTITGIPELIDDTRSGLLVPPGRVDALADALKRLLAEPALRRELGSRGRSKVERDFDLAKCAEQLYALLCEQALR